MPGGVAGVQPIMAAPYADSGKANMIASDASQLRCFMVEGMIEKTKKRLGRRFLIWFVGGRDSHLALKPA